MKYQNIKLFEKSLSRVYLVVMSSDQERASVLQKILLQAIPLKHSLEKFSSDTECRVLVDALLSPSLFGGETVVYLDECESLQKKEAEKLSDFLEKNVLSGYLLLGSRGKTPLSKIVEKVGSLLDMSEEKPWDKEKRVVESVAEMAKNRGKRMASDAIPLLIECTNSDLALISQEINKLICYVGERLTIERADIFRLCKTNSEETPWQIAEEIVWEGKGSFDAAAFPALIFSLRAQLQLGLKITALIEAGIPSSEWTPYFPKVWPRTLEKRRAQAEMKGALYFRKGLDILYKVESLSRTGAVLPEAIFDLFRTTLMSQALRDAKR